MADYDNVFPGDEVAVEEEYLASEGTFAKNGIVYASQIGRLVLDDDECVARVVSPNPPNILKPGDVVYAIVADIRNTMATADVVAKEGTERGIGGETYATIHVSKISPGYTDSVLGELRKGDLIRAAVTSVKPSLQLTTKDPDLGVVRSLCGRCKTELVKSGKGKLLCPKCKSITTRKLAEDYGDVKVRHGRRLRAGGPQGGAEGPEDGGQRPEELREGAVRDDIRRRGVRRVRLPGRSRGRKIRHMRLVALLSDGIDSPVASYLMSAAGSDVVLLHMDCGRYSDPKAKGKVLRIAERLDAAAGRSLPLYSAEHGPGLEAIAAHCDRAYTCVMCKRLMQHAAKEFALRNGCGGIVMGDSLGQVASQTLRNIRAECKGLDFPVVRPLIGMDKLEITAVAQRIGTYEISIERTSGCGAVPARPATEASPEKALEMQSALDFGALVKASADSAVRLR